MGAAAGRISESMIFRQYRRLRTSWLLFISCWLTYLFFINPAGNIMSNAILGAAQSLAERGSWKLELDFPYEVLDVARVDGQPELYSGLPPGASILAVISYPPAEAWARFVPSSWSRSSLFEADLSPLLRSGPSQPLIFRLRTPSIIYWMQLMCAALLSATAASGVVVLFYRMTAQLGLSFRERILSSLTAGFGTSLFPQAVVFGKEAVATFFVFASFTLLFVQSRPNAGKSMVARDCLAGLVAGAAITVDYKTAWLAVLLLVYACRKGGIRRMAGLVTGLTLPLFLLAVYHVKFFGTPWTTAYQFRLSSIFSTHEGGLAGLTHPHLSALWGLTLSPLQGLFIYHPFLIVAFAGFILGLVRSRKDMGREYRDEVVFCVAAILGMVLLVASAESMIVWTGGIIGVGPRHLVFVTPFAAMLFALFLKNARGQGIRSLGILLSGASIGVQLLCTLWGGLLFPDKTIMTKILAGQREVLEVNPISIMAAEMVKRGFSTPLLRVYLGSDTLATFGTILGLIALAGLFFWIWSLSLRKSIPA